LSLRLSCWSAQRSTERPGRCPGCRCRPRCRRDQTAGYRCAGPGSCR